MKINSLAVFALVVLAVLIENVESTSNDEEIVSK